MEGYEKDYHLTLHNHLYSNEDYYNARAKLAVKKYFKGIPRGSEILEFGCGLGQNIYLLDKVTGYDISKFSLEFCRDKGIEVIEDMKKIKDKSIDVVFSCHVLEHLDNPNEVLKLMKNKLKKDGKLILVLPVERHKKTDFELDKNQHLYSWNFRTINNLLIKNSFEVIENKYLRGAGYKILLPISKINLKLYDALTRFVSFISNRKEMKIVAVKK